MNTQNIHFGAVFKSITLLQPDISTESLQQIKLEYSCIISQACDIEQYCNNLSSCNNYLPNILILPLYDFEKFHLAK